MNDSSYHIVVPTTVRYFMIKRKLLHETFIDKQTPVSYLRQEIPSKINPKKEIEFLSLKPVSYVGKEKPSKINPNKSIQFLSLLEINEITNNSTEETSDEEIFLFHNNTNENVTRSENHKIRHVNKVKKDQSDKSNNDIIDDNNDNKMNDSTSSNVSTLCIKQNTFVSSIFFLNSFF